MRLGIAYDLGDGPVTTVAGPRAQVAWEMRTKKRISSFGEGISMVDLVGLLLEQLKVDGTVPAGVTNEQSLVDHLVDINPVEVPGGPTAPGP